MTSIEGTSSVKGDDGEAAHAELAAADRGLVEYTKRQPDGREVAVSQDVWEQLETARQGPVRYYRRERPRLAELEVWGTGDEILHGIAARGGHMATSLDFSADILFDGDVLSAQPLFIDERFDREDELFFDLGSWYWINGYRMVSNFRLFGGNTADWYGYRLDFSDGARQADGSLKWTSTGLIRQRGSGPKHFRQHCKDPFRPGSSGQWHAPGEEGF